VLNPRVRNASFCASPRSLIKSSYAIGWTCAATDTAQAAASTTAAHVRRNN